MKDHNLKCGKCKTDGHKELNSIDVPGLTTGIAMCDPCAEAELKAQGRPPLQKSK